MKNTANIGFLFDLDGVLIDSEREYTRIWRQVAQEYPASSEDFALKIKGCTLTEILSTYYPDADVQQKVSRRLHELEARMHYEYCDGAREFLDKSKETGIAVAMVTSSDNKKMEHLREELPDIFNKFDVIITGNMVSRSKPDPEGYLLGAKKLGMDPVQCVVFEDSLQGVKAGKAAGCHVVGIAGTLPGDVIAPYSDIVTDGFKELKPENIGALTTNE